MKYARALRKIVGACATLFSTAMRMEDYSKKYTMKIFRIFFFFLNYIYVTFNIMNDLSRSLLSKRSNPYYDVYNEYNSRKIIFGKNWKIRNFCLTEI